MDVTQRSHLLYLIVGDGESINLEKKIKEYGLNDCVRIIGRVSDVMLGEIYSLSDILVHTPTSEGFGLVFLEALSFGLPIITYDDLEAISELYDPDYMVLVPGRDPSVLANRIMDAVNASWDADNIRNKSNQWGWDKVSKEYLKLYHLAINNKKENNR